MLALHGVPHLILPSVPLPLPLIPAGLQETYLATMDAVDSVSPGSALFILQGPHQEGQLAGAAAPPTWGSGFSTDPALTSQGASGVCPTGGSNLTVRLEYKGLGSMSHCNARCRSQALPLAEQALVEC